MRAAKGGDDVRMGWVERLIAKYRRNDPAALKPSRDERRLPRIFRESLATVESAV